MQLRIVYCEKTIPIRADLPLPWATWARRPGIRTDARCCRGYGKGFPQILEGSEEADHLE